MPSRPQRASVAEHDVAGLGNVLVDLEAGRGPAQQHRQAGLAMLVPRLWHTEGGCQMREKKTVAPVCSLPDRAVHAQNQFQ
jgi:hypothetical protein